MNKMVVELAGFDTKGVYRNAGDVVTCANPATVDINSVVLKGFEASGRETRETRKARKGAK